MTDSRSSAYRATASDCGSRLGGGRPSAVGERVQLRQRRPRTVLAIVAIAALGGLLVGALGARTRVVGGPAFSAGGSRPAPDFTLPLLRGGGSLTLSDLRGRPVLLNFWASWCHPCREEAPVLAAAWREWRAKGVVFLGVDSNDTTSAAIEFEDRYGIEFPSVVDNEGAVNYDYGVTGTPQTFFIDANGGIRGEYPGPIDRETLDGYLSALVRTSPHAGCAPASDSGFRLARSIEACERAGATARSSGRRPP